MALAGRSNVGKSSLINALCRSKIARTSAAPGKTRLVNFYRITMEGGPGGPGRWAVYLVDLPGYGYARGGDERGRGAGRAIAEATSGRRVVASDARSATLLLVDSRHPGLTRDDRGGRMVEPDWASHPHRRDEDRQAVAQRAREEPEDTRNNVWNGRAASIGNERRRNG